MMKKAGFLLLLTLSIFIVSALQINNIVPVVLNEQGLVRLTNPEGITIYNYAEISPAIPLQSYNFEIPNGKKLQDVTLIPIGSKEISLTEPMMQAPEPVSYSDNRIVTSVAFQNDLVDSYLLNFKTNQCGAYRFGTITYYTAGFEKETNSLIVPEAFSLEWTLTSDTFSENPVNNSSSLIAEELTIPINRIFTPEKLLYVSSSQIVSASTDLLEFRQSQGFEVYTANIEDILASGTGVDSAEKLKNYIASQYLALGIDYVTLAGDYDVVPSRLLWAFDCEFGMSAVENNIPGDIYFSCLDNNWDEDGDGIYGEDEDNSDYYPELFVSRIGFSSADQVASFTERLIEYEKGMYSPDTGYNRSLGLSMNLWPTSNSVITQEYILNQFFPSNYTNTILNAEENTVANFLAQIHEEPNIVQHTGHAFHNVMALGEGYINMQIANNLGMTATTGLMYSIGCWSAAFDFPSIAEALQFNAPVLGYIGNSRYGWGAPGADGFGFSEYFQKEFFRQYFHRPELTLSALNYIQKLPFIPYLSGDSVYKWVAYELNALGDSGYRPMRDNPKHLEAITGVVQSNTETYRTVNTSSSGVQVPDVFTRSENGFIGITDNSGFTDFELTAQLPISAYKYGFTYVDSCTQDTAYPILILSPEIVSLDGSPVCRQNSNYRLDFILNSQADAPINYRVEMIPDQPEFFALTEQLISGTINPSESLEIQGYGFLIEPTDTAPQLPNHARLGMHLNVYESENNTDPLTSLFIHVPIEAPELVLADTNILPLPLNINTPNSFSFILEAGEIGVEGPLSLTLNNPDLSQPVSLVWENGLNPFGALEQVIAFSLNETVDAFEEIEAEIEYTFNNQTMHRSYSFILPTSQAGPEDEYWQMDFENPSIPVLPLPWQIVNAYGENCLSCRPDTLGQFEFELPQMYWVPGMNLSFRYAYRMPMYGADGISIILSTEQWSEEILFLGSGGALTRDNGYIFSDWAEYSLLPEELLEHEMALFEPFTITFSFNTSENDLMPDYVNQTDTGIFIDNLSMQILPTLENDQEMENITGLRTMIYPNPVKDVMSFIVKSPNHEKVILECFNLRGQKILKKILDKENSSFEFSLDISSESGFNNSGIYFYRIKNGSAVSQGKFIVVK